MVGSGAVSYMFDRKGEIRVIGKGGNLEEEMLELIDLGVEDVEDFQESEGQYYLVYTSGGKVAEVSSKITQAGYKIEQSGVVFKPNTLLEISNDDAQKVLDFAGRLEDLDDVQKVYANFDIV